MWGSTANDVWIVGGEALNFSPWTAGRILHWNGTAWAEHTAWSGTDGLTGVWGRGANEAWAVGYKSANGNSYEGSILRWDGATWTPFTVASPGLSGVWGAESADGGILTDGGSAGPVWAVGPGGTILNWNGSAWLGQWTGASNVSFNGVWGAGPNDVWAVGVDGSGLSFIAHWDGASWSPVTFNAAFKTLWGVWGSGPNDVWAVGTAVILHWNGSTWSTTPFTALELRSVWGTGPADVWVVGGKSDNGGNTYHQTIFHWNGASWANVWNDTTPSYLRGVWGAGNPVWAVGSGITILRYP